MCKLHTRQKCETDEETLKKIKSSKQVFLVTGGVVGVRATTEIFQEGKWRYVGELPRSNHYLKCVTLDNTVLVTGKFCIFASCVR